jgi:hypothetical protein
VFVGEIDDGQKMKIRSFQCLFAKFNNGQKKKTRGSNVFWWDSLMIKRRK